MDDTRIPLTAGVITDCMIMIAFALSSIADTLKQWIKRGK